MGKRGPRPKPTNLRVLHGDKKDRINTREPQPPAKAPAPPRSLSEEGRRVWRYYAKDLTTLGLLTTVDRDAFATFCEAVVAREKAQALLGTTMLVRGSRGDFKKNPAFQIWRDSAMVMRSFAQEFGLTPSARSSIEITPPDEDELASLILGGTK